MSRNTFHWTILIKVPSNLALSTSREQASTTFLGNLFQCLATLKVKNFFLLPNQNLPPFSLKLLPFVLSLHAFVDWKTAIRSLWSLFFSRLNNPNSLSLSP